MNNRVIVLGFLLLFFLSCSKNELVRINEQNSNLVSSPNKTENSNTNKSTTDILEFENVDAYDSVINVLAEISSEELMAWERNNNPKSYKAYLLNNNIEPDSIDAPLILSVLLNENAEIIIAKYAFKLDFNNKTLKAVYCDDKNPNFESRDVKSFTFEDDVLAELSLQNFEKCNEGGTNGADATTGNLQITGTPYRLRASLWYRRVGIYFDMRCDAGAYNGAAVLSNIYVLSIDIEPVVYKARCQNMQGPNNFYSWGNTWLNALKYQSYQGSRALNRFRFRVRARVVRPNPYFVFETHWIEIRKNM